MDVMAAMRKQAAMEVAIETTWEGVTLIRWKCPACKEIYVTVMGAYNYCPECGQALFWSNTEPAEKGKKGRKINA